MKAALTRYRIMAYIVGTLLIVLFFIAMPMEYIGGDDALVGIVGVTHGWLYVVYLAAAFDLARRAGWPLKQTLGVLIAGTIPVVSFLAERWVRRRVTADLATADA